MGGDHMDGGERCPRRRPLRLPGFDYAAAGYYFVTMCTRERECMFWGSGTRDPECALGEGVGATIGRPSIHLSALGQIVENALMEIPRYYPTVQVDKYVVMPNHIHAIIVLGDGGNDGGRPMVAPTLSRIVQQYKGITRKRAACPLWQRGFYDHVIRDEADYLRIWEYIDENPIKWMDDEYYK